MIISDDYEILFLLLRQSTSNNPDAESLDNYLASLNWTNQEWERLAGCAARQGVLALAYDALSKGGAATAGISKELLIRWELSVKSFENRSGRQREALKELVSIFREQGIELLLLKGMGLAENYPHPSHRESGDLDIYLFGDYEKGNQIIEGMGIEVKKENPKHSNFFFKGIPVENHINFLDIAYHQTDRNLESHLNRILGEQGYDTILIDGVEIRIPTPDFTAIFLMRHDITHFLFSGLVLRHLCDLSLFFSHNKDRIDLDSFWNILLEEHQLKLFFSFMEIAGTYLEMPGNLPINQGDNMNLTERILEDTLYNKRRKYSSKDLINMWAPKRKALGVLHILRSKWKYDAIGPTEFIKQLKLSLCINYQLLVKKQKK